MKNCQERDTHKEVMHVITISTEFITEIYIFFFLQSGFSYACFLDQVVHHEKQNKIESLLTVEHYKSGRGVGQELSETCTMVARKHKHKAIIPLCLLALCFTTSKLNFLLKYLTCPTFLMWRELVLQPAKKEGLQTVRMIFTSSSCLATYFPAPTTNLWVSNLNKCILPPSV